MEDFQEDLDLVLNAVRDVTGPLGEYRWLLWLGLVALSLILGIKYASEQNRKFKLSMSGGTDGSGATMWRSASGIHRNPGRGNPFYGRPGWFRVLPFPVPALLACWVVESPGTLRAALWTCLVLGVVLFFARRSVRKVRRRYVRPIFFSLARYLELKPDIERPEKWVKVPVGLFSGGFDQDENDAATLRESILWVWLKAGFAKLMAPTEDVQQRIGAKWSHLRDRVLSAYAEVNPNADRIRVRVPESFSGVENGKALVSQVVKARIPGSWDAHWVLTDGPKSRVYFVRSKKPPKKVLLTDLYEREDVLKVTDYFRPPVAMDHDHAVVRLDMKDKNPHILISAPTGWGKTTTALGIVTWFYIHGGIIDIVDPKQTEFLFIEGTQGVTVHNDDYAMTQAPSEFLADLKWRQEWVKNQGVTPDDLPMNLFPPRMLLIDEMGSFIRLLKDQWKAEGGKGEPPAFSEIMQILWRGRAFRMHLVTMAQQANARVLIDSDARDNYGYKFAAGPQSLSSWRMMFGNVAKPRIASRKGAAILGDGPDDLTDIQIAYVSQKELPALLARRDPELPMVGLDQTKGVLEGTAQGQPAKIVGKVPGQGTPALISGKRAKNPFSVISGGLLDDSQEAEEPHRDNGGYDDQDEPEELIIGIKSAVEFINTLGPKKKRDEQWFTTTRKRHPIDGEIRSGNSPAWTPTVLKAWNSKRESRAGKGRAARTGTGDS